MSLAGDSKPYQANALVELENSFNGNVYNDFQYTYALDGNILSEIDGSDVKQFAYDKTGKLISETNNGITTSYTYDLKGNRSSKTENGVTTSYTYDANNRLINETINGNSTIYGYDNNGNRTIKLAPSETTAYYYNLKGQLFDVSNDNGIVFYDYNAEGLVKNRMSNTDTSWFVWNGDKLVCDYTMINGIRTYSHGVGGVNYQKCNNNTTYYLKNGHGNIISECATDGTVNANNTYDAFGNTNLSTSGFGYCGEYQDTESNLTYLRARFYDQSTGAFISEDPIKDGMNWYSYCGGNPVKLIDPNGLGAIMDKEFYDAFIEHTEEIFGGSVKYICDENYSKKGTNKRIIGVEYDPSNISNGSLVGISLLEYFIYNPIDVKLDFNNSDSTAFQHEIYINRAMSNSAELFNSHLIHELTHSFTIREGYISNLSLSLSNAEISNTNSIIKKYMEATAISVENQFRNEMGYGPRTSKSGFEDGYAGWPLDELKKTPHSGIIQLPSALEGPFLWYLIERKYDEKVNN